MKKSLLLMLTFVTYCNHIHTFPYQRQLTKQTEETIETIIEKWDKNSYTILQRAIKCHENQDDRCLRAILKEIAAEKQKTGKALRNCVVAEVAIATAGKSAEHLALAAGLPAQQSKSLGKAIIGINVPPIIAALILSLDYVGLMALDERINDLLSMKRR